MRQWQGHQIILPAGRLDGPFAGPRGEQQREQAIRDAVCLGFGAEFGSAEQRRVVRDKARQWIAALIDEIRAARAVTAAKKARLDVLLTAPELTAVHDDEALAALSADEAEAWCVLWDQAREAVEASG